LRRRNDGTLGIAATRSCRRSPCPANGEMERRELISNYKREVKGRVRVINTQHSLFWNQGIPKS